MTYQETKEYDIPVCWTMTGSIKVKAKSLQEALTKIDDSIVPVPSNGHYLYDSLTIARGSYEFEKLEEKEKIFYEL